MINGNWVGVMMLVSLLILVKGALLFVNSDPRYSKFKFNFKESLRDLLNEEEQFESERKKIEVNDFNPVDHVHVTKYSEIDQEDSTA